MLDVGNHIQKRAKFGQLEETKISWLEVQVGVQEKGGDITAVHGGQTTKVLEK
jgi:hypothetical protein